MIPAQQPNQTASNLEYYPYKLGQAAGTSDPKKSPFLFQVKTSRRDRLGSYFRSA